MNSNLIIGDINGENDNQLKNDNILQNNNNSSLINLPLISDSSKLNQMSANILISSDPISGTTILQIDPTNQYSLFQSTCDENQTTIPSNLFDFSSDLTHYVIQTDSLINNSTESFNNINFNINNNPIQAINSKINDNLIDTKNFDKVLPKKKSKPVLKTRIIPVFDNEQELDNESHNEMYSKTISGCFKCKLCSLEFNKLNQISKHFKVHTFEKPFKCSDCEQSFNIEVNLRLHKSTVHYNSIIAKPFCPECNKNFTRLASLKSHIKMHKKDEMLMCNHCSEEFVSHYYLRKHINEIHSPKKVNTNEKQSEMNKYLKKVENKRLVSELICTVCHQKFKNTDSFREHTKLHNQIKTSLKHRVYKKEVDRTGFNHFCNTCGKSFKKNSQLIRHIRTHTGEKPYVCEFCNKGFSQKNSLNIHRTKHTGERKFKCKFCSATFTQSGNMRSHIRRLHAPQVDTPVSQLHKCPFCNCVFKKVGILNCHISRRHSTETNDRFASNSKTSDQLTQPSVGISIKGIEDRNNGISSEDMMLSVDKSLGDLLSKALENSGVTQVGDQALNYCDKEIAQIFDPATGTRQTHIVRRVGKISYRQCLYCQKEFKKSSDLVRHVRIHTHDKPFKCCQCYRAFTVKGTLSAHMRTHNGIKPYACQICCKLFSSSQSLKVHTRLHTGATPYHCDQCEKMFRTLGHLKSHLATHLRQNRLQAINSPAVDDINNSNLKNTKILDESILSRVQLEGPVIVVDPNQQNLSENSNEKFVNSENDREEDVDHLGRPKRKYQCTHCEKAFKKSSHLTQHIRSHTGEKPFQCEICSQRFVAKGSLKIHLQVHSGLKPFKCTECSYIFSTRGSLTRHMARHRDSRPFMCPYCQKTFKSSLTCKKHIKLHRTEFALQLLNEENGKTFDNTTTEQNINQINTENALEMQSENDISSINPTVGELSLIHINVNDSNLLNENINLNPVIDTVLQSTQTEYYPIKDPEKDCETYIEHLYKDMRPYTCETCGNSFKKSSHLKQHIRRHTGEKPFQCEFCFRSFATRGVLNTHINTHSSIKNFQCETCSATFVTNNSLRRHVKTIHENNALKCPHCSGHIVFKNELSLNKHINSNHMNLVSNNQNSMPMIGYQINVLELNDKTNDIFENQLSQKADNRMIVFESKPKSDSVKQINNNRLQLINNNNQSLNSNQCDFCPKSFRKPSDLVRHRRIHTGEKPYVCEVCMKCFTVKSTLDGHVLTHKGERNFKCDVCSATFSTNGSLKVHMRLHTGSKPYACNQCDAKFRTSGHRKCHLEKHNKNKIKSEKQISVNDEKQISIIGEKQVSLISESNTDLITVNANNQTKNDSTVCAVTSNSSQLHTYHIDSALLSQLLQDSNLLQQLQSQGIVITADVEDSQSTIRNSDSSQQIF